MQGYIRRLVHPFLRLGPALVLAILSVIPSGCSSKDPPHPAAVPPFYTNAFPGLVFDRPVFLAEVPGKPETFLVLEQPGKIRIVSRQGAAWYTRLFGTVEVTGGSSGGDERGLLGFAFHPDFQKNRKFYLYYVKDSEDMLVEGMADSTLLKDSRQPRRTLLDIPDPYQNHNGGTLAFGPKDGFLYLGTGDGGSAGDPHRNGQDRNSLLGKFLRLDVDRKTDGDGDGDAKGKAEGMAKGKSVGKAYGIPADNPFQSGGGAPEVWAYGMRNPWKWSFDPVTGDLWAGDVGQNTVEEVSLIEKGGNYGWNAWEGDQCYPEGTETCVLPGYRPPVFAYRRGEQGGNCVTGGFVYRGDSTSAYSGTFIFGDFGSGNVWSLRKSGAVTGLPKLPSIGISSFGTDSQGRMFVMGLFNGTIYRMDGLHTKPK